MIEALAGLAAGALHVVAGVDHLAALAPLAVEDPKRAGFTGAKWGLGHGIGTGIVAGVGLALRGLIDMESISEWAEFTVGFLLIGVGLWAIWRARTLQIHTHTHDHDGDVHAHVHAHGGSHRHAPLGVGVLHGMAGTGHLFGVLPALGLPTGQAVAYLAFYLIAAVAAMAGFAWILGKLVADRGDRVLRAVMTVFGLGAIAVGVFWLIQSWPA